MNTLELTSEVEPISKHDLAWAELRRDPSRSNRKIAEILGVDHKTVGNARAKLAEKSPPDSPPISPSSPTPTEHRRMLIAAAEEFDKRFPAETAEECVDRMIAERKLDYGSAGSGIAFDSDESCWEIPAQEKIEVRPLQGGGVEIRQLGQFSHAEDATIHVADTNVIALARRLLWAAGFKASGVHTDQDGGR